MMRSMPEHPEAAAEVTSAAVRSDDPATQTARLGPGPWLLAVPGLAWWAVNVAVITEGVLSDAGVGEHGWLAGRPALSRDIAVLLNLVQLDGLAVRIRRDFDVLFALPAVPSVVLGLLAAGAVITVRGHRGWRQIGAALSIATACGALSALLLAGIAAILEAMS